VIMATLLSMICGIVASRVSKPTIKSVPQRISIITTKGNEELRSRNADFYEASYAEDRWEEKLLNTLRQENGTCYHRHIYEGHKAKIHV
jgi:hypothetical protein